MSSQTVQAEAREEKTEKTDPLSILVVNNMLLTGFDAPVEQVMYLDRKVVAHDLLQAIARVNRTCGPKEVRLRRRLHRRGPSSQRGPQGLRRRGHRGDAHRHQRRAAQAAGSTGQGGCRFHGPWHHGPPGAGGGVRALLEDLKIRAEFINKLRMFYETLNILEHRPEVPADVFRDAKLLGFINKVAANLYRDPALNLLGVAEKVKALIDAHVSARGVDPKIPPTAITDAEFEKCLQAQTQQPGASRADATCGPLPHHRLLQPEPSLRPKDEREAGRDSSGGSKTTGMPWNANFGGSSRNCVEATGIDFPGSRSPDPGALCPIGAGVLFHGRGALLNISGRRSSATIDMVERIRQEMRKVGFWKNAIDAGTVDRTTGPRPRHRRHLSAGQGT